MEILIYAAIMAASQLIQVGIANAKTPSEKARLERIKQFEKTIKRGETGLNDQEEEELYSSQRNVFQAAQRDYFSREGELAALQGLSGGNLLAQQDVAQERMMQAEAGIGQVVAQADRDERAMDIARATRDIETQDAVQQQKKQNLVSAAKQTGDAAAMAYASSFQMPQTQSTLDPNIQTALFQKYKVSSAAEQAMLAKQYPFLTFRAEEENLALQSIGGTP